MSLQIETTRIEPDITVVRLVGSLIAGSEGHALEQLVLGFVGRGKKKLIFDLSGVEKIDSTGARSVIHGFLTVRQAEGELRFAAAPPSVSRLFSITRLNTVLSVYETVAAASVEFELKRRA